ncbi:MAG: GIY-YIG nuclease family protein [Bacteroidetes bacterium]|nr:GIY-YIG nuclease family protein [Bacteroidota bacterium]
MYFCYILYSSKLDRFYKGSTENVESRVIKHNKGDVTFTSRGRPWTLVWCVAKDNKTDALKLEKKLKNLGRGRIIQFILKYHEGMPSPDASLQQKSLRYFIF